MVNNVRNIAFQSILIIGGTPTNRLIEAKRICGINQANQSSSGNVDNLIIQGDGDVIGIERVRDLRHWINLRPYKEFNKTVIISEAQYLTEEAQNALLKTLEEPPARTLIVLTAQVKTVLLPTIISRCAVIEITDHSNKNTSADTIVKDQILTMMAIITMTIGERLELVEGIGKIANDREKLMTLIDAWIEELRNNYLNKSYPLNARYPNVNIIEKALHFKKILLETNANCRLALETFLISI